MNVLDRIENGKTTVSVGIDNNNQTPEQIADSKELLHLARRGARYRWIPVSERLPDDGKEVIICTTAADVCAGFARWGGSFTTEEGCELYLADVTHWMPLPEPEEDTP